MLKKILISFNSLIAINQVVKNHHILINNFFIENHAYNRFNKLAKNYLKNKCLLYNLYKFPTLSNTLNNNILKAENFFVLGILKGPINIKEYLIEQLTKKGAHQILKYKFSKVESKDLLIFLLKIVENDIFYKTIMCHENFYKFSDVFLNISSLFFSKELIGTILTKLHKYEELFMIKNAIEGIHNRLEKYKNNNVVIFNKNNLKYLLENIIARFPKNHILNPLIWSIIFNLSRVNFVKSKVVKYDIYDTLNYMFSFFLKYNTHKPLNPIHDAFHIIIDIINLLEISINDFSKFIYHIIDHQFSCDDTLNLGEIMMKIPKKIKKNTNEFLSILNFISLEFFQSNKLLVAQEDLAAGIHKHIALYLHQNPNAEYSQIKKEIKYLQKIHPVFCKAGCLSHAYMEPPTVIKNNEIIDFCGKYSNYSV